MISFRSESVNWDPLGDLIWNDPQIEKAKKVDGSEGNVWIQFQLPDWIFSSSQARQWAAQYCGTGHRHNQCPKMSTASLGLQNDTENIPQVPLWPVNFPEKD